MPVNKVEYFGNTLLDLTGDNVTPSDVKKGVVFHDATGAQQIGEGAGLDVNEQTNSSGGKTVYINSEPEKLPELPEGFTRLKWIQTNGDNWVDTGIYPRGTTRVIVDCDLINGDTHPVVCGAYEGTGKANFVVMALNKTGLRSYYGSEETDAQVNILGRHTLEQNRGIGYMDGVKQTETAEQTFTSTKKLFLGTLSGQEAAGNFGAIAKYYSCQIYDNGTIVRNYIPCLNASGEAGLWDTVTQAFFGDAAGVGFIAGPVVLDYTLPEGFEELAWIESDGRQYVDSQFKPNQDTRVVCKARLPVGATNYLYGCRKSSTSAVFGFVSTASGYYAAGYYNGNKTFSADMSSSGDLLIDANKGTTLLTANGKNETIVGTSGTFSSTLNLLLFGYNDNGTVLYGKSTIYACQIYDNGTLVRYYVPCRTNTGEVGLWDAVSSVFYGDAAGVGFIAGPKKGVSKVVLEDEVLIDLTGDTVTPEGLLAGLTAHDAMGQLIQGAASAGYQVVTGTITLSNAPNTLTVSGLPFTPIGACVVRLYKTASSGYHHGVTFGADTTTNRYGYGEIDYLYGNAPAYYYNLSAVTKAMGSISLKVATNHNFSGEYHYVVWGE